MTSRNRISFGLWLVACAGWVAAATDTTSVQTVQTAQFSHIGTIAGPVRQVDVYGHTAYAIHDRTITAFDISNPSAPKQQGSYTFPFRVAEVEAVGSLLYVAVGKYGLGILDRSGGTLKLLGSVKTPGETKDVAVIGTTVLMADHMSGVDLIDVSNAAKPVLRESFYTEGYARSIAALGSVAAAVDNPTGLYVFDFGKPGPFEPISAQQSASFPNSIVVSKSPTTTGPKLALLVGGTRRTANGQVEVYDLSNPAAPIKLSTFASPSSRPQQVALDGTVAYLADGPEGLQILDLSVPSMPRIIGHYKTSGPALDVAVEDSIVLVVVGEPRDGNVRQGLPDDEPMPAGGPVLILRRSS